MVRGVNPYLTFFQIALDVAILVVVSLFAGDKIIPEELARVLAIYCSFILVVIFPFFHLYQLWRKTDLWHQIRALAMAWVSVLVVFNLIIILLSKPEQQAILTPFGLFTTAAFNFWALFVLCGLTIARAAIYIVLGLVRSRGFNQQAAIILGAGETGKKLARYISENRWMGITMVGFFDEKAAVGSAVTAGSKSVGTILGTIDKCYDFIENHKVDIVFLALPMSAERQITQIIGTLGTSGHVVLMVQDLFSFGIKKARTQSMGELQVLDFYLFPLWKRIFDIVFSFLVISLTLPFWLIIMLAIKAEDGGPVFFRHDRVMEGGKRFSCLKFRSMYSDGEFQLASLLEQNPALKTEWELYYKLSNDPRVTKVGRILRRLRLDELPQFLNVLAGKMSVVGARPVVPEELEKYYKSATLTYCAMKPGITGLWQVSALSEMMDYAGRVELDRQYILNCTIWTDLVIIVKTVLRVFSAKGI